MNWISIHLRAVARALALCLVTGFFYIRWLALLPFLSFSHKYLHAWRSSNFRGWAKATSTLMGVRISVKGVPPQAPFFLVSNHLSYLDIVILATQIDGLFIAKNDVASWPILGVLCRSMGTIFVDRNLRKDVLRVNAIVEKALASGKGVLLFPEGTSTAGNEVLPFHSALLEPAVKSSYPVSYAALSYKALPDQPPAAVSVCWWGDMTFLSHLYRLFQLRRVDALITFGSHSIRDDNRKTLAQKLRQVVLLEFNSFGVSQEKCQTLTR